MSSILVIRHTRPDIRAGLCYGRLDVACESGAFENWTCREALALNSIVYSSPSRRCHDLALKAWPTFVCRDERLMEFDFGDWEGRHWDDIPREESAQWMADCFNQAPPGGERLTTMIGRVRSFIKDLPQKPGPFVLFTHGGVIRLLLLASHRENLDQYFGRTVDYGAAIWLPRQPEDVDFDRLLNGLKLSP